MDPRKPTTGPAWPTSPAKLVATLKGHSDVVTTLTFSADRCLLASGSRDGTARIWDVARSKPGERAVIRKHGDRFDSLAFSPDTRTLAAGSGALNGLIWLFDVSDKTPRETAILRGARGSVDALGFSSDCKQVAGAGEDRTLRVWELTPGTTGEARVLLLGHTKPITSLAFASDGRGIATGGEDAVVRLWTLSRIRSWERAALTHDSEVDSVAFSTDGRMLATACQDSVIRLWDPTAVTPTIRAELKGHSSTVRLVWITPDSGMLVSVDSNSQVINWDLRNGKAFRGWEVPGDPATTVALTPDGRYLAKGTATGTIELYRVAEKRS